MSNVLATDLRPKHTSLQALSPAQARAAITLAHGGTVTAAADAAGVHRSTIYNWFESDSDFQCAIKEIFDERNRRLLDQMRELDALALDTPEFDAHRHAATTRTSTTRHFSTEIDIFRRTHPASRIRITSHIRDSTLLDRTRHRMRFSCSPTPGLRHSATQFDRIGENPATRRISVNAHAVIQKRSSLRLQSSVANSQALLAALGGEAGCKALSAEFYARVGTDPVLLPLFPGKTLKCAIEEFAAFLIQFLGGDEEQTQRRWWLSLQESHARFRIHPAQRQAWLNHMGATLDATPLHEATRDALRQFFVHSSAYVTGKDSPQPEHEELAARWNQQLTLDGVIAAIAAGNDQEVIAVAPRFVSRPSVFVGLLARMVQSGRAGLIAYAVDAVRHHPSLGKWRCGGRALLHYAAGAGCLPVVTMLLRLGTDVNILDTGSHTPLYRVANECVSEAGPEIVRALVRAGADVNACGGVTRSTPLHMAARRGFVEIARVLLDSGAAIRARDTKGDTPLRRALNCRKNAVAQLLQERGA
jgi:hemoglobin